MIRAPIPTSTVVFTILLTFLLAGFNTAHGQSKIYWVSADANGMPSSIMRANLDGSEVETVLIRRLEEPSSLELDLTTGKIYWSAIGEIGRANLDGSAVEKAVAVQGEGFFGNLVDVRSRGVSVDENAGKLYWINRNVIQRSNLDGSEIEDLITSNVEESDGLEVDPVGGKVYWTNSEFSGGVIRRANLDGSGVEDLVSDGLFSPRKIELDTEDGKMYWTDLVTNDVFRANLDGTSVEAVVEEQDNPEGIALDLVNDKVYWTDLTENAVRRSNLDGSELEELPMAVDRPIDVAVDPSSGFLYVVVEDGELYRASLDGSDSELLIEPLAGFDAVALDTEAATFYFGASDGLQRSDLDGNNVETIGTASVDDIQLDGPSGVVYWAGFDGVHRVNMDGTGEELLVESDRPFSLTLDLAQARMYWLGDGNPTTADKIRTANLDGTEASILLSDLDSPNRLIMDRDVGSLFWTEGGYTLASAIRRASPDGTNLTDVVNEQVTSFAVDAADGKIYWADRRIKRANLDGSGTEELHSASFSVTSLTLDPAGGKMYWITEERIERANLDGSGFEVIVTDLSQPEHLIIDSSTSTAIDEEVPSEENGYRLEAAFPNPFRDRSTIALTLDHPQNVHVGLYNVLGQRVATLHSGWLGAGHRYELIVDAADHPAGVYYYSVRGEQFQAAGDLILTR